jgi:hypothetical protein
LEVVEERLFAQLQFWRERGNAGADGDADGGASTAPHTPLPLWDGKAGCGPTFEKILAIAEQLYITAEDLPLTPMCFSPLEMRMLLRGTPLATTVAAAVGRLAHFMGHPTVFVDKHLWGADPGSKKRVNKRKRYRDQLVEQFLSVSDGRPGGGGDGASSGVVLCFDDGRYTVSTFVVAPKRAPIGCAWTPGMVVSHPAKGKVTRGDGGGASFIRLLSKAVATRPQIPDDVWERDVRRHVDEPDWNTSPEVVDDVSDEGPACFLQLLLTHLQPPTEQLELLRDQRRLRMVMLAILMLPVGPAPAAAFWPCGGLQHYTQLKLHESDTSDPQHPAASSAHAIPLSTPSTVEAQSSPAAVEIRVELPAAAAPAVPESQVGALSPDDLSGSLGLPVLPHNSDDDFVTPPAPLYPAAADRNRLTYILILCA